ncbi:hypothetical protein N7530_011047 [Penicillium desertorum]|uniref:Uncharacterized protein n=1 Tax=Penicillium desertorum TaxID=1303715 RepID=A0A9W9WGJ0_9EURO|nr:hypothetical protein N7530_011047 [Penicillium desertorum]
MQAGVYLTVQNGFGPVERQRFADTFYEAAERLGISLPFPTAGPLQQQVGSKRVYQGIDEQQPVAKRQRTQDLLQEQDVHGAAQDGEPSSSSVSSSSSEEEEEEVAQIKVQLNRQENSPIKVSDQVPVVRKMTQEDMIHPEENDGSSSFTQKQSSEQPSSEEDGDDYSSEEEKEGAPNPTKEVSQAELEHDMKAKAAIRPQDENSEPSSSSSEDESSEEGSSEGESDEGAEPRQQQTPKEDLPKGPIYNLNEPIQLSDDDSSDSSSEDESSDEESEAEFEEQIEKHLATPEAFFSKGTRKDNGSISYPTRGR